MTDKEYHSAILNQVFKEHPDLILPESTVRDMESVDDKLIKNTFQNFIFVKKFGGSQKVLGEAVRASLSNKLKSLDYNQQGVDNIGDSGNPSDMEARIARLESDVAHIQKDVSDIKADIREFRKGSDDLRNEVHSNKFWLLGIMAAGFLTLSGVMWQGYVRLDDKIEAKTARIETKTERVEERLGKVEARLEKLDTKLDMVLERLPKTK